MTVSGSFDSRLRRLRPAGPTADSAVEKGDGFSAGEAAFDFVPVADGRFVGFPAKKDFAAFVEAGEIEQGARGILEFDADLGDFVDELFEAFGGAIEVRLELVLLGGRKLGKTRAQFGVEAESLRLRGLNIGGDAFDEGKGAVGFIEREVLFGFSGLAGAGNGWRL
jgi:hypothetical protein